MLWPGSNTVTEFGIFCEAATWGEYFALAPTNAGCSPDPSVIEKVFVGSLERGLRGSFRSVSFSLPVFVRIAVTRRFSTPRTELGADTLRESEAPAETPVIALKVRERIVAREARDHIAEGKKGRDIGFLKERE